MVNNLTRSSERETYGDDDFSKTNMTEGRGICVATQLEAPNPGVQGIAKIRMQYVDPAFKPLANFADLPMSEKDQVRLAFGKSIRKFYAFRYMHNDPGRRNMMWDPQNKRHYIIDLEDAYEINDDEEPTKFMPELY
ncbi:hypothetical protein ACJ72_02119 [Emergomyces africanus]|uniref:Uncharacterized protein n=1 Tax=Emergomyces africanus TaxID=1955775 RepID=A0A1B7P3C0_9EURO|nr:hypothetical protein ACJ72_02119 [Emergomyces africanus]